MKSALCVLGLFWVSLSELPQPASGASLLVKAKEALFSESLLEAVEVSERQEALVALGHVEVERSEEGTRLLTSVTELRRMDIGTLDSLETLEGPGVVARLLDVSGRSGALLVEEVDGGLSVFLPYDGESVAALEGYSESYYAARFGSQDSELMLLKAKGIDMLDTDTGEVTPVADWENSFGRSTTLQVGGNGKRAVVIEHLSRISTAMAIDLESGEDWYLSLPYTGADGAFSPDGERFVVVGSTPGGTHSIYWYDLMSGEISGSFQIAENAFVHEYYGEDTSFVLSGDSRYVVAFSGDALLWFNLESQAVERVVPLAGEIEGFAAAFAANPEQALAVFEGSGRAYLLEERDGERASARIERLSEGFALSFEARADSLYRYERSINLSEWQLSTENLEGDGEALSVPIHAEAEGSSFWRLFRFER